MKSRVMIGLFALSLIVALSGVSQAGEACCDKGDKAAAAGAAEGKAPCGAAAAAEAEAGDEKGCAHAKAACDDCPGAGDCPHKADCPDADCACKKGAGDAAPDSDPAE